MNAAEGDWDVLSEAGLSLLSMSWTMLKRKDQSWAGLVLSSGHFGISRMRWPLNRTRTVRVLDFSSSGQAPSFSTSRITRTGRASRPTRTHQQTRPRKSFPVLTSFVCVHVATTNQCWSSPSIWASHTLFCCQSSQVVRGAECAVHIRRNQGRRWRCSRAFVRLCCKNLGETAC